MRLVALLVALPAFVGALTVAVIEGRHALCARDESGPSGSFAVAIAEGDVEQAYAFIRAGQDPNAPVAFRHPDITGERQVMVAPLLLAVATGRDNAVSMLLSVGVRADAPGSREALCLATQMGHDDIVDILVKYAVPAPAPCVNPPPRTDPPLLAFVADNR